MDIKLTRKAEGDLESVEAFIREENPAAAIRTVLRILEAIEGLVEFPNIGRPGRVHGTRELVINRTPFIAVYKVIRNTVWILRVLHVARRWQEDDGAPE
jgi:toxin ParE1/3/4